MGQADWVKNHVQRYKASNGANGHIWDGLDGAAQLEGHFPTLLLTTTGRKSQQPRTTPLIYGRDGQNFIVIASQGGRPKHPSWYLNLEANSRVELQVIADTFPAKASALSGPERERLWHMMVKIYPPYDDYEEKASATREIPLVLLEPN